jgi:2-phospho-L-lactate/phosphoenolpyruvate guanylyltransferase
MTVILIPCKDLDRGKSRLAGCLTPRSRRALCEFFLCRTLDVATQAVTPRQVRVVTSDPRVETIARDYGVAVIPDRGGGLNAALENGRRHVLAQGGGKSGGHAGLVLPIDLPLATPAALGTVLSAPHEVVIVPDEAKTGTNVLRLGARVFSQFRFSFGARSYAAHCAEARAVGFEAVTVEAPNLAFDVDRPVQYRRWAPENPAWNRP